MTADEIAAMMRTLVAPEKDYMIRQLQTCVCTWSVKIPLNQCAAALLACQELALITLKRLPLLETMR
jgi:hypothetical protein